MSYTTMPLPPVDIILGEFPRYYYLGNSAILAKDVDKEAPGSIAAIPVQIPKELTQEIPLQFQLRLSGVTMKDGVPYENIKAEKHTPETKQIYVDRIRRALYTDLIQNGLPLASVPHLQEFTYTFQKKHYTFQIEDLRMFDLLQYPSDIKNGIRPTGIPNIFNLAERPMYLPCEKDGKLQLFTAQHLSGTELFQIYVDYRVKYIEEFNTLMQYINDYDFSGERNISTLWNVIYGTTDYYGKCERIKISLY